MKYLYSICIPALFLSLSSFAQDITCFGSLIKQPNADLVNATYIKDSIAGPFNVSLGYGDKREIGRTDGAFYGENNSAWFKFKVEYDTVLTLDILPLDSTDDYDFVLFKCSRDKKSNKETYIKLRECWSQCYSKSGMTGLSMYSNSVKINGGSGPAYAAAVSVKKGDVYYLMIDYEQSYLSNGITPKGFTIYFYNLFPKRTPVILNNIFFETGKAILLKESFFELDKLAGALLSSQAVIEIRGHTDNVGNEKENQKLSEERAKAVVDYLISKKVDNKRLHYKGFGSTQPVASNKTEEGRSKNRRVEFVKMMY